MHVLGYIPHLLFSDMTPWIHCWGGGLHCQLSLSQLQIGIDLADCEPQAERWTLSDTEEPPVRRVVA